MKFYLQMIAIFAAAFLISCEPSELKEQKYQTKIGESNGYSYEFVSGDPLKTRIYTLENGLKVYLSDYKDAPRIHTFIAVKAGGKNDPSTNTGLAHYLEHMMFKGTSDYGTLNWEKEKPMLDSIRNMFDHYKTLTDDEERKSYYQLIDSYSNEAAKYAIPNEYDKMVSSIGATGTNAYTTEDRTVYTNNIPANQIENYLQIESNRFKQIVNRLFHTELEAVYEEKNRSLDNDAWKVYESIYELAFNSHPYGTQTVIGTIDHLKNPSITEIEKYFYQYYVPNNVAICMSGDLDYDSTIALIDNYFSDWKPNQSLETWEKVMEEPIESPKEKEVLGPDAESLSLAFRFDGRKSESFVTVSLIDMLLNNSEAGLIDLNLVQKQKVLGAGCYVDFMNDYSLHTFYGNPREGQSLAEVKNLILGQIELIKNGEFEDWLIDAVVTDLKKSAITQSERNYNRADKMVTAFTNDIKWEDMVSELDRMQSITKEDVVNFANKYYNENYVIVYKRTGKDENVKNVEKPSITKVEVNREEQSDFHKSIINKEVNQLEPVFIDYEKDVQKFAIKNDIQVIYNQNIENDRFTMYYLSDIGGNNDPMMKIAVEYLNFLGTDSLNSEEFRKELYKLGCSIKVYPQEDRSFIELSGLNENMIPAMKLFERLLNNPSPDPEALKNMIDGILKTREDQKKDKYTILYQAMVNYAQYGKNSPFTNVLSNEALLSLTPDQLTEIIKKFTLTEHRILYYGPMEKETLKNTLNENHLLPDQLIAAPASNDFPNTQNDQTKVFWADYDMVQAEIIFANIQNEFDPILAPEARLYNEYFGGGMGSIVFQEIREAQGLAYAVNARYRTAPKAGKNDTFVAYIGTQADKQKESMEALLEIINNLPESQSNLETAKRAIMNKIESERVTKTGILFNYETAQRKKLNFDIRKAIYEEIQEMDFEDIKEFQEKYVKDKNYNIMVLGSHDKLNFNELAKYGEVKELSLEELFGYEKVNKLVLE